MDEKPVIDLTTHTQILNSVLQLRNEMESHRVSIETIIDLLLQQVSALPAAQQDVLSPQVEALTGSKPLVATWFPGDESEPAETKAVSLNNIRRVALADLKAQDTVSRLKSTALGAFYIKRLKKYRYVRWAAFQLWRTLYPIYINHFAIHLADRKARRWRDLCTLHDFAAAAGLRTTVVAGSSSVVTPTPRVVPARDQSYLKSPHDSYVFPEISVTTINDAVIYGGTNLVLKDDIVICHDLYDFVTDYTSEELHGRTLVDPALGKIRWLQHDQNVELIPEAAAFVDACASNYAHWLTEVLPRIAAFCSHEQFKEIPVIVNDGLHKNIMDSLFLVTGTEREIITLSIGRALRVATLHVTSVAGYVPFERRVDDDLAHSHGLFSTSAFSLVSKACSPGDGVALKKAFPKKIFIRRNSGARKVVNASELEELLVETGFVIIEPEKLTFRQQVQLFREAEVIIASSGAAVANIVFASPTARIYVLISKFPNTSYWYWQNMACASGKTVNYILGETVGSADLGIHADFIIDLDAFKAELGMELGSELDSIQSADGHREDTAVSAEKAAATLHGEARSYETIHTR